MDNITDNTNNPQQHTNLNEIFGESQHFANSIFTYYTNFIDVLLYNVAEEPINEYCNECGKYTSKNKDNIRILELKKGRVEINNLSQLLEYRDWALKSLADGDETRIQLFFVGSEFDANILGKDGVICIRYSIHDDEPRLRLARCTQ
jgi:hypothetical protein